MPHLSEPVSIVEDLDPDPPGRAGRQVWELVLGLVVLASVLGFAGWQWLRQGQQQADYAAAVDAAQRQDLETALSRYEAASGYKDSDNQAHAIATILARRDDQYNIAAVDRDAKNWAACLKSIQQVVDIQPGYKDAAQIEQQASRQVYNEALSGTIALRTNANPAGLYYYGGSGWALLPRSDAFSKVRGESPAGRIVYDVPGKDWSANALSRPQDRGLGSPELAERRLVVALMPDLDSIRELALNPGQYNTFEVGDDGVWALRNDDSAPPAGPALYFGTSALDTSATLFESYTSAFTASLMLPVPTPEIRNYPIMPAHPSIMAFDTNSDRYLIAWPQPVGPGSTTLITTLYLGQPGNNLRNVYFVEGGGFDSAQFSPDGRYVLARTYVQFSRTEEYQDVLLLDLQGGQPPLTLATSTMQLDAGSPELADLQLTAAFLSGGPFDGDVLVAEYTGSEYRLRVFDTGASNDLLADLFVPTGGFAVWTLHPGSGGMSLVSGQQVVPEGYALVEVPLWFVSLSRDKPPAVTRLRTLINNNLQYARLVGDILAYSSYELGRNGRDNRSVFSFPVSRFGMEGENAWTMFTQMDSASGEDAFSFGDYGLGPTLLAYVTDNDLHARLYDGSVDVTLEHHIAYLYNTALHRTSDGRLR